MKTGGLSLEEKTQFGWNYSVQIKGDGNLDYDEKNTK